MTRSPEETADPPAMHAEGESGPSHPQSTTLRGMQYTQSGKSRYRNNLLPAVGFFELTNALDFPANVWNQIPAPLFARVLMGIGGSVAALWTVFAIWDLCRSWRNIRFLWRERKYLKERRRVILAQNDGETESLRLVDSWMAVNFRELGWEYIERTIMDTLMGLSAITVGAGTLMAIRGDIPAVFKASNLLSGYIGNSFNAVFALINTGWTILMWREARKHSLAVSAASVSIDPKLRIRLKAHAREHQFYAILNGVSVLVSSAGSLISATLWPGYVVIAPCVFTLVFSNLFWRHKLGYDRRPFQSWVDTQCFDVLARLKMLDAINRTLRISRESPISLENCMMAEEKPSSAAIVQFLQEHGLLDDFYSLLRSRYTTNAVSVTTDKASPSGAPPFVTYDHAAVMDAANSCLQKLEIRHFRDEERFLLELYGCYLCIRKEVEQTDDKRKEKIRT